MTTSHTPAFPVLPPLHPDGGSAPGYPYPADGMTLRDYFAAKAMQGFLANPYLCERWGCESGAISAEAYQMADAMLAERAKP